MLRNADKSVLSLAVPNPTLTERRCPMSAKKHHHKRNGDEPKRKHVSRYLSPQLSEWWEWLKQQRAIPTDDELLDRLITDAFWNAHGGAVEANV